MAKPKVASNDQGFRSINAKLETTAAPYDPFAQQGDPNDTAEYLTRPGATFQRPWLAIRNGPAFQWPLGLEGFTMQVDPTLGIHKFIGDNAVTVDVIHAGEEHFTMQGNFPGNSAPTLLRALRDLVYQQSKDEGKILYIPEIMAYAQRVQVVTFQGSRAETDRGRDATYSIEFVRLGVLGSIKSAQQPILPLPQRISGVTTPSHLSVSVDAVHNSLRKIAAWKLGDSSKWRTLFNANEKWFVSNSVPLSKAPDARLPTGLKVFLA